VQKLARYYDICTCKWGPVPMYNMYKDSKCQLVDPLVLEGEKCPQIKRVHYLGLRRSNILFGVAAGEIWAFILSFLGLIALFKCIWQSHKNIRTL